MSLVNRTRPARAPVADHGRKIVAQLAETTVSIEREILRAVTSCGVEEIASADGSIGGKAPTSAEENALSSGALTPSACARRASLS